MSGINPVLANALANPPMANPQYWGQQMQNMNALQDYNAKQATAQAYRDAIGPDGQFDQAKFNQSIVRGQGAWNAGPAIQQQGQAQNAQAVASTNQLGFNDAQQTQIAKGVGSMINQPDAAQTPEAYKAMLAQLHAYGTLDDRHLAAANAAIDAIGPNPDATTMRTVGARMLIGGLAGPDIAKIALPHTTAENIGGQNVAQTVTQGLPGHPGTVTQGTGGITRTLTPESATDLIDVQYPDGTHHHVMRQDLPAELGKHPDSTVGAAVVSGSEAPVNAAGDSATRKAGEGGPPAAGTPAAAVAQRTHDFWISQGYNEAQVAGILAGGPGSESDFTPTAGGDKVNGVATSYGLYQHHAERLAAMQKHFNLPAGQMPNEQQQNQYAAYEISPQGPLAAVGAQLKQAQTPAQAAAIWTRSFGVPGDKTEIGRRANGAQRFAGIYAQPQGPQAGQQTPPATTPATTPPAATPAPPASPFGASAFAQPSTALPAPASQATAPNTTAAVPPVPTPQMVAAVAVARQTRRPAPIAGTDGLFANPDGSVGSGPRAGGISGKRADIPNALLGGVQLAQTTMPPATALTAGPGAPTAGLPSGGVPTVPPPNAYGNAAFGNAPAAPPAPAAPVVQPPAQAVPPQAGRGAGWSAPPGYVSGIETRQKADIDAYTKNSGEVAIHQNNVNTLQNAYHALQLADTGPGTQNLQAARAFLQSFGIATSATGDQATQWAEAHKYLMDFARTQGGLGGTDLQAQLAQGSNASTDIPKPAALAVVRNNIAKERLAMAQVQEANGSAGYVEHTKNFAPAQDLRAFQADIMPPQELKQIEALQKTNPQAFAKFQKSLDIARAHGLISDEDLAAQNQRIRALGP